LFTEINLEGGEHYDYTDLTTQICKSNNISPDLRQISSENMLEKKEKKNVTYLDYHFYKWSRVVEQ
jgi:hypothetical protein